jgi:uncharacterized integral membrane protein
MARSEGLSNQGSPGRTPGKKRVTRENLRLAVAVVGLVLLVAFVLDNSRTVKVGFVFFSTRLSLIWVLLIAALLGALVDRLVFLLRQRRKSTTKEQ